MTADDVLSVLDILREASADVWIGGGWGIDALAGRQTREHRDLDLGFRSEQEPDVVAALAAAGYVQTLDWRPVRFAVTDPGGREIDLHPLAFRQGEDGGRGDGSATQANVGSEPPFFYPEDCFVIGSIGGEAVPCLSVEQQIVFHQGYEPADQERHDHDMAVLRGLPVR